MIPLPLADSHAAPTRIMALHALAYCERLYYLEEVEEIRVADNRVFAGRELHAGLADADSDAERVNLELSSATLGLYGKVDCIRRRDGACIPYEHKRGQPRRDVFDETDGSTAHQAWPSDRLQIIAYAVLLEEAFGQPITEGRVHYHAANVTVRVPIDERARADLQTAIARARELRQSVDRPPITDNERLCQRCSLAPVCLPEETRQLRDPERDPVRLFPPDRDGAALHVLSHGAYVGRSGDCLLIRTPIEPDAGNTPDAAECPPADAVAGHGSPHAPREDSSTSTPPPSDPPSPHGSPHAPREDSLKPTPPPSEPPGLPRRKSAAPPKPKPPARKPKAPAQKPMAESKHPIRQVESVLLHGFAQITTQALRLCTEHGVGVHWLTPTGYHTASLVPTAGQVQRRIRQYHALTEEATCLRPARALALAKVAGQHRYLLRASRGDAESRKHIAPALGAIQNQLDALAHAADRDALRGHEGTAAVSYFEGLRGIIGDQVPQELRFISRNRRPPLDRFNALLGFGYGLLHSAVLRAILAAGLEPALGFFHTPRSAAYPLVLDLMELFRVPLWDLVVVGSLNRGQWDISADFAVTRTKVWLSDDGRKKAIALFEARLQESWKHPVLNYSLSYSRTIELEARLLEKEWTGEPGLFAQSRLR